MRLIDAEQFITEMEINIGNIYNPDIVKGMKFAIDLIKSRPTAYDVEEVIEQLDNATCGRSYHDYAEKGIVHVYLEKDDAIEIVRKGGVE